MNPVLVGEHSRYQPGRKVTRASENQALQDNLDMITAWARSQKAVYTPQIKNETFTSLLREQTTQRKKSSQKKNSAPIQKVWNKVMVRVQKVLDSHSASGNVIEDENFLTDLILKTAKNSTAIPKSTSKKPIRTNSASKQKILPRHNAVPENSQNSIAVAPMSPTMANIMSRQNQLKDQVLELEGNIRKKGRGGHSDSRLLLRGEDEENFHEYQSDQPADQNYRIKKKRELVSAMKMYATRYKRATQQHTDPPTPLATPGEEGGIDSSFQQQLPTDVCDPSDVELTYITSMRNLSALEETLSATKADHHRITKEVELLREHRERETELNIQITSETAKLKQKLHDATTKYNSLSQEIIQMETRREQTQTTESLNQIRDAIMSEVSSATRENERLKQNISTLTAQQTSLRDSLRVNMERNGETEERNRVLLLETKSLKDELILLSEKEQTMVSSIAKLASAKETVVEIEETKASQIMKSEITSLSEMRDALKSEISVLNEDVSRIRVDAAERSALRLQMDSNRVDLQGQLSDFNIEIQTLTITRDRLKQEVISMSDHQTTISQETDAARNELSKLRFEIAALRQTQETLQQERDSGGTQIQAAGSIAELQSSFLELRQEFQGAIGKLQTGAKEESEMKDAELAQQQTENQVILSELKLQVKSTTEKRNSLQQEMKVFTEQSEAVQGTLSNTQTEMAELAIKKAELVSSFESITKDITESRNTHSDLVSEVKTLRDSIDDLTKTRTELSSQVETLNQQRDSLENIKTKLNDAHNDLTNIETEVNLLTDRRSGLQQQITSSEEDIKNGEEKLRKITIELSDLTNQRTATDDDLTALANKKSTMLTDTTRLEEQKASLKQLELKIKEIEGSVTEQNSLKLELETNVGALQGDVNQKEEQKSQLEADIQLKNEELSSLEMTKRTSQAEVDHHTSTRDACTREAAAVQNKLQKLKEEIEEATTKSFDLQKHKTSLQVDVSTAEDDLDKAKKSFKDLSDELNLSKAQLIEVQSSTDQERQTLSTVQNQITASTERYAEITAILTEAEERADSLQQLSNTSTAPQPVESVTPQSVESVTPQSDEVVDESPVEEQVDTPTSVVISDQLDTESVEPAVDIQHSETVKIDKSSEEGGSSGSQETDFWVPVAAANTAGAASPTQQAADNSSTGCLLNKEYLSEPTADNLLIESNTDSLLDGLLDGVVSEIVNIRAERMKVVSQHHDPQLPNKEKQEENTLTKQQTVEEEKVIALARRRQQEEEQDEILQIKRQEEEEREATLAKQQEEEEQKRILEKKQLEEEEERLTKQREDEAQEEKKKKEELKQQQERQVTQFIMTEHRARGDFRYEEEDGIQIIQEVHIEAARTALVTEEARERQVHNRDYILFLETAEDGLLEAKAHTATVDEITCAIVEDLFDEVFGGISRIRRQKDPKNKKNSKNDKKTKKQKQQQQEIKPPSLDNSMTTTQDILQQMSIVLGKKDVDSSAVQKYFTKRYEDDVQNNKTTGISGDWFTPEQEQYHDFLISVALEARRAFDSRHHGTKSDTDMNRKEFIQKWCFELLRLSLDVPCSELAYYERDSWQQRDRTDEFESIIVDDIVEQLLDELITNTSEWLSKVP